MKRKLLVFFATLFLCCSLKTFAQYANTTLSNLTPPTQINADLIPNADISYNLGSSTSNWRRLYFRGFGYYGTQHIIQINRPNTFVGYGAGQEQFGVDVASEQASYNTGIGFMALSTGSSNYANTAVGANALSSASYQTNYNTAVGAWSLQKTTGTNNTGIGYYSLISNTGGMDNTAVGGESMQLNEHGTGNSALGVSSLHSHLSGDFNTALGFWAMYNSSFGSNNVAIGYKSIYNNSNGSGNIGIGQLTLYYLQNGNDNIGIGTNTLLSITNGSDNIGIGRQALNFNTTGSNNVSLGYLSAYNNSNGSFNTAIGPAALFSNQSGQWNTAIGYKALYNTNASGNVGIGQESLYNNNNGQSNTSIGTMALYNNTNGSNNIAIGYQSAYNNNTGSYNVAIGWTALFNNGVNAYNVGIGLQAGYHSASRATFLGTYADAFDGAYNVMALGYGAQATANNQVKIGNPEVTSIGGYANWTNFSDGRYKQNIKENVPGLEFINQLKPVTYTLDIDGIENAISNANPSTSPSTALNQIQPSGSSSNSPQNNNTTLNVPKREVTAQETAAKQQKAKVVYTGFVAQDVEKAAKAVNYDFSGVDVPKNKNDFYGLRYSDFVIPLVKAVQELSQKTDQIEALKKENEDLKTRLENLEKIVMGKNGSLNTSVSDIRFEQNRPNPFNNNTTINYYIPNRFTSAQLIITDNTGKLIKEIALTNASGNINIDGSRLSGGSYQYSLIVDGITIGTKRMVVVK